VRCSPKFSIKSLRIDRLKDTELRAKDLGLGTRYGFPRSISSGDRSKRWDIDEI